VHTPIILVSSRSFIPIFIAIGKFIHIPAHPETFGRRGSGIPLAQAIRDSQASGDAEGTFHLILHRSVTEVVHDSDAYLLGGEELFIVLQEEGLRNRGPYLSPSFQHLLFVDDHNLEVLHVVRGGSPPSRFQDLSKVILGNGTLGVEEDSDQASVLGELWGLFHDCLRIITSPLV
jgi:hypothetical protein